MKKQEWMEQINIQQMDGGVKMKQNKDIGNLKWEKQSEWLELGNMRIHESKDDE